MILSNAIRNVKTSFFYQSSLLKSHRKRSSSILEKLGVPLDLLKNNYFSLEELVEITNKSFAEISCILNEELGAQFVESVCPTKQVLSNTEASELNILLDKGYAIHFNQLDSKTVIITSNIIDLLSGNLRKYDIPFGFTTKKAYADYCATIFNFREFFTANRKIGRSWINVLALCLLDACNYGARDVFLGMDNQGYQYIAKGKKYQGAIDERVVSELVRMTQESNDLVSLFREIYPVGTGKCYLSNFGKAIGVVITFDAIKSFETLVSTVEAGKTYGLSAPAHLLLIDDDPQFLELLKRGIAGKGFRVSSAVSANDALLYHLSSDSSIDLVITDLHLPKFGGLDLVKTIKNRRPNLPIIALTTDKSADSYVKLIQVGADVVVHKEDDSKILIAWITKLLNKK